MSSSLRADLPQLWQGGATLPCGAQALGTRASAVVAHGLSCSMACGIFPGQGSNQRPLHWQADSQPLRHQGSPDIMDFNTVLFQKIELKNFQAIHCDNNCLDQAKVTMLTQFICISVYVCHLTFQQITSKTADFDIDIRR